MFAPKLKIMVKKYRKIVQEINSLDFSGLDDSDLSDLVDKFKAELSGRTDTACRVHTDDILPQVFAIVREVIDRRLGIWRLFDADLDVGARHAVHLRGAHAAVQEKRASVDDSQIHLDASFYRNVREMRQPGDGLTFWPYDVQLMGALALYEGKIAEMGTGEGKTVVAVFPVCLWALSGKKVHIATVNDYLALRDCTWMGPAFRFLGLSVDCVLSHMPDAERKQAYKADIVYGNNYEFGFDYLRDNIKNRLEDRVQSKLEYVIIDEIDSILIDEATTPLIISGEPEDRPSGTVSNPPSPLFKRESEEVAPFTKGGNLYWKFKPTVESLLEKQGKLVESLFHEMKMATDSRSKFIKLIQIAKADPWNAQLLDYLSDNEHAAKGMHAIQSKFAAARSEYKLEEDLLYVVDEQLRTVKLTDRGMALVEQQLGQGFMTLGTTGVSFVEASLLFPPLEKPNPPSPPFAKGGKGGFRGEGIRNFLQLLRAYVLHGRDEDYIVHSGGVVIVDEFTGRLAFGKKYEEGLHQAIECKEGLQITPENRVVGRITHPNYFRLYEKMVGMTATAHTEAEEFRRLYNLEVVRIPTNRPVIRADLPDRFYRTEEEKLEAIVDEIEEYHSFGRPVLVGTRSVEKSEDLSALLNQRGIPHNVLNAKNHAQEAEIIKCAGQPYAVTIATNMAGRGTDIALGKDLYQVVTDNYLRYFDKELKNGAQRIQVNVYSQFEYEMLDAGCSMLDSRSSIPGVASFSLRLLNPASNIQQPLPGIRYVDFGLGLHVIGSERHGARRIDYQLRGRSGRQGDLGSSRFYLSLQDDLFRIFGREETSAIVKAFDRSRGDGTGIPACHTMARLTRRAQRKSEEMSYYIRRHLIERDDIADKQRRVIYGMRQEILADDWTKARVQSLISDHAADLIRGQGIVFRDQGFPYSLVTDPYPLEGDLEGLREYCMANFGVGIPKLDVGMSVEEMKRAIVEAFERTYDRRERVFGVGFSRKLAKAAMIGALETAWADYLSFQSEFDRALLLRSYVKSDTMTDYRLEFSKLFDDLLVSIRREALRDIFTYPLPAEKIDSTRRVKDPESISKQVRELVY